MEESVTNNSSNAEQMYKMIDKVRSETRLSYKLASHAVHVVLECLISIAPSPVAHFINETLKEPDFPPSPSNSVLDKTRDILRLFEIAENLNSIKNDAQQRSWQLFDDQKIIMDYLNELNLILIDADDAVSRRFLHLDDYGIVNCLAEYYQMESRWSIKMIILKTLDSLCILSRTAIVILLGTVLPLELARDIQNNFKDKTKLFATISVMTKMFSIGEPLPIIYIDTIGKDFVLFMLRLIETPSDEADEDDIVLLVVNLILVYNLQFNNFEDISTNITIQALEEIENPKIFSETLLLLFNRGKDPVKCLDYQPYPQNSLLKMMKDIFSSYTTSNLFYKNDVRVLIDIVMRQFNDGFSDNKEKIQWLVLIKEILFKTDKTEYSDQLSSIKSCIIRILTDTENENIEEQLIKEILEHLQI